jgi:hypothetical protein
MSPMENAHSISIQILSAVSGSRIPFEHCMERACWSS